MTYQINIVTFHYVFSNKYRLFKPQRGLRGFLISQRINNPLPLFVTTSRCISDFPIPNLTPNPRIFLQPDYRNTPSRDPKQHNPSHKWISQPTRQAFPCDKIANNNIGTTKERDGGETKWQERERERVGVARNGCNILDVAPDIRGERQQERARVPAVSAWPIARESDQFPAS